MQTTDYARKQMQDTLRELRAVQAESELHAKVRKQERKRLDELEYRIEEEND